jgi:hypothetical protein
MPCNNSVRAWMQAARIGWNFSPNALLQFSEELKNGPRWRRCGEFENTRLAATAGQLSHFGLAHSVTPWHCERQCGS